MTEIIEIIDSIERILSEAEAKLEQISNDQLKGLEERMNGLALRYDSALSALHTKKTLVLKALAAAGYFATTEGKSYPVGKSVVHCFNADSFAVNSELAGPVWRLADRLNSEEFKRFCELLLEKIKKTGGEDAKNLAAETDSLLTIAHQIMRDVKPPKKSSGRP